METDDQTEAVDVKPDLSILRASPPATVLLAAFPVQRALLIRIKMVQGSEERRIMHMSPPFRGFSSFVRFQLRAKIHTVQQVVFKKEQEPAV